MQPIPEDILKQLNAVLVQKAVSASLHDNYRKGLRYYLDFGVKYPPPDSKSEQVRLFIEKDALNVAQLELVKQSHEEDLKAGYACVFLDDSLEKKYRNAAKTFVWQWFFPQQNLTYIP